MTPAQFDALAQLLRLHSGSATADALRLVLVEGLTHDAAAAQAGAQRQSVTRAVGQARKAIAAAQVLAGADMPPERNY